MPDRAKFRPAGTCRWNASQVLNTSPTNYSPIRQMQLASFSGTSWELFGDLLQG